MAKKDIDLVIENIRKIRNHKNISILELSTRTGISHSFLFYIESKKKSPTLNTLAKIADGLDVKMVEFFQEEKVKKNH